MVIAVKDLLFLPIRQKEALLHYGLQQEHIYTIPTGLEL